MATKDSQAPVLPSSPPGGETDGSKAPPKRPWVYFLHEYAEFPGFKRGDICYEPTERMLEVAALSSCLTILR